MAVVTRQRSLRRQVCCSECTLGSVQRIEMILATRAGMPAGRPARWMRQVFLRLPFRDGLRPLKNDRDDYCDTFPLHSASCPSYPV